MADRRWIPYAMPIRFAGRRRVLRCLAIALAAAAALPVSVSGRGTSGEVRSSTAGLPAQSEATAVGPVSRAVPEVTAQAPEPDAAQPISAGPASSSLPPAPPPSDPPVAASAPLPTVDAPAADPTASEQDEPSPSRPRRGTVKERETRTAAGLAAPCAYEGPGGVCLVAPPQCTMIGTPNDDILIGDATANFICGLGGADRIDGGAGDDTLVGGGGDDVIDGGAGDDAAMGEDGSDRVSGGRGQDCMVGGDGADQFPDGGASDTTAPGERLDPSTGPSPDRQEACYRPSGMLNQGDYELEEEDEKDRSSDGGIVAVAETGLFLIDLREALGPAEIQGSFSVLVAQDVSFRDGRAVVRIICRDGVARGRLELRMRRSGRWRLAGRRVAFVCRPPSRTVKVPLNATARRRLDASGELEVRVRLAIKEPAGLEPPPAVRLTIRVVR